MKQKLLLAFVVLILAGCQKTEQKITTQLPTLSPLIGSSFSCTAIASTDIWREESTSIVTTVRKGSDQLAISIEGDSMAFNTRASVEAGMPSGTTFQILRNDSEALISAYLEGTGYSMNTFTLNKKTGLAVWSKTRPEFPTTDAPTADTIYLHCK